MSWSTINKGAEGISYYTPAQTVPAGTVSDGSHLPAVFRPLTIRGLKIHNRIWVAPMCQYSAHDGHMTDWHLVNVGSYALRGAGLVFIEATAVEPEGRITPEDVGLWKDSQIEPMRRVAEFIKSQNTVVALQIAHAGRKASTTAPWLGGKSAAGEGANGWPGAVVAPTAEKFHDDYAQPNELTEERIADLVEKFYRTAKRGIEAGVQVLENHCSHGYLAHEFLSPLSNKRTDKYGGSLENRCRYVIETTRAIKRAIDESGKTIPLFARIPATDWVEGGWTVDDCVYLGQALQKEGVDLLDVTSAGLDMRQKIKIMPGYQAEAAVEIKRRIPDILVTGVGMIWRPDLAENYVASGKLDAVMAAREFLRDPSMVLNWAKELGVQVRFPIQYHMASTPRQSIEFTPHKDTHIQSVTGASPDEATEASIKHHAQPATKL
ncbi:NADH-dependent flavin oxidoreductase [Savitreella phatthalungensis]